MKKKILSVLFMITLVISIIPMSAWGTESSNHYMELHFTASTVYWGETEKPNFAGDVEISHSSKFTPSSSYDCFGNVLEDLATGILHSSDPFDFHVDTTADCTINLYHNNRYYGDGSSETINKKVTVSGGSVLPAYTPEDDEIFVVYPGNLKLCCEAGSAAQINYDNTLEFVEDLSVLDGANLILGQTYQNTAGTTNMLYIFDSNVTVAGALTFKGDSTATGTEGGTYGSATFTDGAGLTVQDGGVCNIGSIAVAGDSETPLITVESGGSLNFTTDGITGYGTITNSGTCILVKEGGELTIGAGTVTSTNEGTPAIIVENGGSLTIVQDEIRVDAQKISVTAENNSNEAVSLGSGATVVTENATVVVSDTAESGGNYVDNYGNIILAPGSSITTDSMEAGEPIGENAVLLADGTVITGADGVTYETNEDGTVSTVVTVAAGGSVNGVVYSAGGAVASDTQKTEAAQDISYAETAVEKHINAGSFTNELTESVLAGEVTYTSSDESVATVDQNGLVTIVSYGKARITATAAAAELGNVSFAEASAGYTLAVTPHDFVALPAADATCTDNGRTAGAVCSICGEVLVQQEVIPATGHEPDEGAVTQAPTCTEAGEITYTCTVCGEVLGTEEIPATGHNPTQVEAVAAACTEPGNIEYWYCEACGKYFADAACTNEINEADTVLAATGHNPTQVAALAAACTEPGNIEYWYCADCGKYFADAACTNEINEADTVLAATGHNLTHVEAVAAAETADGNIEYWYCGNCGLYFSNEAGTAEIAAADTVIPATGVTPAEPDATPETPAEPDATPETAPESTTAAAVSANAAATSPKTGAAYLAPLSAMLLAGAGVVLLRRRKR